MKFADTHIYAVSSKEGDWSITLKEGKDCSRRKKIKIDGK